VKHRNSVEILILLGGEKSQFSNLNVHCTIITHYI